MVTGRLRKSVYARLTQCEQCAVGYCPVIKQQECARLWFMAIGQDKFYECPDYQQSYWEKLCA